MLVAARRAPALPTARTPARPSAPRPSLLAPPVLLWPDGGRILLEAGDGALADSFGAVLLDSDGGALVLTMDDALLAEDGARFDVSARPSPLLCLAPVMPAART